MNASRTLGRGTWPSRATFVICLTLVASSACFAGDSSSQPTHGEAPVGKPLNWVDVGTAARIDILQMLAGQAKGNHERIRTWQGSYDVRLRESLSQGFVANNFTEQLPNKVAVPLVKLSVFTQQFVIDYDSDSVFRSKSTNQTTFLQSGTKEHLDLKTSPVDEVSVITAAHYLHFSPKKEWSRFAALPDRPEVQRKRVAFRDPTKEARGQEMGDLMDPRDFFGLASHTQIFGTGCAFLARELQGTKEQRGKASAALTVRQAEDVAGTWYQIVVNHSVGTNSPMIGISTWSPADGYSPVRFLFSKDKAGSELLQERQWRWKVIDGIRVPAYVKDSLYRGDGGTLSYQREATLRECVVNGAIPPGQFSYQGLGLKDDDVVMDRIEEVAYIMKSGELRKFANFREKYSPSHQGVSFTRWLLAAASILVLVVSLVLLRLRRTSLQNV